MESHNVADTFMVKWWPQIDANKNKIAVVAAIVAGIVAIGSFISWRHEQNRIAAGDALTQTLFMPSTGATPPQLADAYLAVANEYPNTPAGERSLMQAAAELFAEGKYTDAQGYFQQYLDAHPDGDFSGQAALGVAKSLAAQGKLNDAAGAYQHVINDFSDEMAVIAARFALAQIDLEQHNAANAMQLFQQVAQADAYGAMGTEAREYIFDLRSKIPTSPSVSSGAAAAPFSLSH